MHDEIARLASLKDLRLLDTLPSENFDRITRLAANIFGLPIAAVSLTDTHRQWFKSKVGVEHNEIPRYKAPCAEVAESRKPFVINDFQQHECFIDSTLGNAGIRFYAGAPLLTAEGFGLGALCVLGTEPREVTPAEMATLVDLAAMVMDQVELTHALGRIEPTSGLPNRFQLLSDLSDMKLRGDRSERVICLLDLAQTEQFEHLSRVLGPSYFDTSIQAAANILREHVGPDDVPYHVGPTQFAFFAEQGVHVADYEILLEQKLHELEADNAFQMSMTPSIGIVSFQPQDVQPEDVLRFMQSAAQDARDSATKIGLFSPAMDLRHRRNYRILQDFRAALAADDQLSLVFQPRMDVETGEVLSAEALLRWDHPILGPISPAEFIPVVEVSSCARSLTDWVLDEALSHLSQWRARGLRFKLSINLSALNLEESDFFERLMDKLATCKVDPDQIELELTETVMMKETEGAFGLLDQLKSAGVQLAIDDFGTGYSSIAYLQKLPADIVKIDRSFVSDMVNGNRERVLVRSMMELSHSLGYRVVAEGVETQEEADLLQAMGCDEIQGYWLSRPVRSAALIDWLLERHRPASLLAG
ncbi:sensor domain-containing phosphodiesterase [Agrobacterium rubi]|uniref:GGDEF and EAL domain-containing protein n=1 Tax=Agrobacterium rubi TaxID=28099 RepID=A0AAE7R9E8_9HYPH|nr:sensor domain-containing phosphodiesterase [Agrobacterium rubi]NTE88811.1 GGDEF and EAL domain-containing protein [Agrobacterium rubi]NTF04639.1 GGDEF and EAL domain-containing protein [Agrobacterium rubi]NTF39201.1 GGDEF and EAL domain-containing protein [Agrobacterium rubi]OCJ51294.1 diguanylate phosphodiesterase [Agrobacterium rubi]QTG02848.1 GGDEF and EAL domain-containing protein [Agrobacterium rubi]